MKEKDKKFKQSLMDRDFFKVLLTLVAVLSITERVLLFFWLYAIMSVMYSYAFAFKKLDMSTTFNKIMNIIVFVIALAGIPLILLLIMIIFFIIKYIKNN